MYEDSGMVRWEYMAYTIKCGTERVKGSDLH